MTHKRTLIVDGNNMAVDEDNIDAIIKRKGYLLWKYTLSKLKGVKVQRLSET